MKNKIVYKIALVLMVFSSCSSESKQEFYDISKFSIEEGLLEDNAEVRLIYYSGGPDNNQDYEFYYHLIAIAEETGDTVNILTSSNHGISKKDQNKVYNFYSSDHIGSKALQLDPEKLKDLKSLDEIKNSEPRKINKVLRNKDYDNIALNNYPTVIGSIGTFKPREE